MLKLSSNPFHSHCFWLEAQREENLNFEQDDCYRPFQSNFHGWSASLLALPWKAIVGGERECPIDRQREDDCNVESLICNGCITQMLGVICQPGLSCWGRAALRGKQLDTVLSLFTPTHNGGACKYQPLPFSLRLSCPPRSHPWCSV